MLPAPPLFNVNYFINPPLAPFACNNSLYVSLLCPVFCVLHPASRVLWTVFCVLRPASGFTPCASRSYLLCPLIIAQRPLCIAPSCRLCICAPFQLLLSPIYCRKVIPNPAPMFHALPCASCVLRPALRPTMRFVPCVRINIALYLLCRAMPLASLVPPLAPCHTSPLQLWFILPHSNSKRCAPSFSPLQPRI